MKHTIESLGRQFAENTLGGGGPVAAVMRAQPGRSSSAYSSSITWASFEH